MPDTHCLPSGSLGTSQIAVCNVGSANVTIQDATGGAGHRRGIFVFLHPSQNSDQPLPLSVSPGTGFGEPQGLFTSLVADGWVCAYPASPQDYSVGGVGYFSNVYNDVNNDAGNGTRFLNTTLEWWDHLLLYFAQQYGAGRPIVVGGFSWGAWQTIAIAIGRTSTVKGYVAHLVPTIWENITFDDTGDISFAGMDYSTTALNGVTIPGIVGMSDTDSTVGWALSSQTTVLGMSYQGIPQSNAYLMAHDAIVAGQPVTIWPSASSTPGANPQSYGSGHLFLPADATEYASWIATNMDPLAPANTF